MKNTLLIDNAIARLRQAYVLDYPCADTLARVQELRAVLGDEADLFFRIFARMMNRKRAADALLPALNMLRHSHIENVRGATA